MNAHSRIPAAVKRDGEQIAFCYMLATGDNKYDRVMVARALKKVDATWQVRDIRPPYGYYDADGVYEPSPALSVKGFVEPALTITAGVNDKLKVTANTSAGLHTEAFQDVTIPPATYVDVDALVPALQGALNAAFAAYNPARTFVVANDEGKLKVTLNTTDQLELRLDPVTGNTGLVDLFGGRRKATYSYYGRYAVTNLHFR
jgi:hypothetical protein